MLPQSAAEHYRAQQRLAQSTLTLVRREWDLIGEDFDSGWSRVGPRLTLLTTAAQVGAARAGANYISTALDEVGQSVEPLGAVNPQAFAGIASDGRPLASLLYGAVVTARQVDATSLADRVAAGRSWLDMAVHTQVADAARGGSSVAIAARPRVSWVRIVSPPCCQRCAALAGRVYRYSEGFKRHPRCDCLMLPQTITNPDAAGIVIGPEDVKDLTAAQRKAIGDGADMNQVINAHRAGARSKDGMTTSEGVTKRGFAGQRLIAESGTGAKGKRYLRAAKARLTPEAIYRVAASREEALALLNTHGYLIA